MKRSVKIANQVLAQQPQTKSEIFRDQLRAGGLMVQCQYQIKGTKDDNIKYIEKWIARGAEIKGEQGFCSFIIQTWKDHDGFSLFIEDNKHHMIDDCAKSVIEACKVT